MTDKGTPIVERLIRSKKKLFNKPVFEKRNADWISELPSVIKENNNFYHNSIKMTPIQASRKANEKEDYSNLQHRSVKQIPKFKLGQLVRTADNRIFNKNDSTNYSYEVYTISYRSYSRYNP